MNEEIAKQYLEDGEKIRFKGWRNGEYIQMKKWIIDESGIKTDKDYFEEHEGEWEIVG